MTKSSKPKARPESETLPSSQGDSPRDMTPHDISPDSASWNYRTVRQNASSDPEEREDALLDEGIELTFPASDPVAIPSSPPEHKADAPSDPETRKLDKAVKMTFPASDPIAPASITRIERPRQRPSK
jgi:hypothetical protein